MVSIGFYETTKGDHLLGLHDASHDITMSQCRSPKLLLLQLPTGFLWIHLLPKRIILAANLTNLTIPDHQNENRPTLPFRTLSLLRSVNVSDKHQNLGAENCLKHMPYAVVHAQKSILRPTQSPALALSNPPGTPLE